MKARLEKYAKKLLSRIADGEAAILKRAYISGGDWQPKVRMCHHNVTTWCNHKSEYTPVRGWLYFDLSELNCIRFVAHSAVLTPQGELYDITPKNASQDYPFLSSNLSDEEFEELVELTDGGEINISPIKQYTTS